MVKFQPGSPQLSGPADVERGSRMISFDFTPDQTAFQKTLVDFSRKVLLPGLPGSRGIHRVSVRHPPPARRARCPGNRAAGKVRWHRRRRPGDARACHRNPRLRRCERRLRARADRTHRLAIDARDRGDPTALSTGDDRRPGKRRDRPDRTRVGLRRRGVDNRGATGQRTDGR